MTPQCKRQIREFRKKYYPNDTPFGLYKKLGEETGELGEALFYYLSPRGKDKDNKIDENFFSDLDIKLKNLELEIGDVQIVILGLCDSLNINIEECCQKSLSKNIERKLKKERAMKEATEILTKLRYSTP
jgi:NTP pyrophosphatase (non-canonical NTP hydrolase)